MTFLLIVLGIVVYLLIGGIVYAAFCKDGDNDDLIGMIFAWPLVIFMAACLLIVHALKAFGHFTVNFFKRFIYEGEQNEEEN
jgi:predicted GNAT superfamily acetyltransferase